MVLGVIDN